MAIIVSVSGGKDSTAMLLKALEEYPKSQITPIFCDTGWEHESTYEYLEYLEKALDIKIIKLKTTNIPAACWI
jgi:3''-phosphoadenosine 5''-phosphosulfate sulfotransferase (PAPS reductase)/FAD synthetase and related enzymes